MKKNIKKFILLLLHFFFFCYLIYSSKDIKDERPIGDILIYDEKGKLISKERY